MNTHTRQSLLSLALLCLSLSLPSCGGGGSDTIESSSGDPEADRRAELRVGSEDPKDKDTRPLYDRLGGQRGITALVDDITQRVIADPRVNFERTNVKTSWLGSKYKPWNATPENTDRFRQHMVEFITLASGGPSEYTGRDMHTVHQGMRISNPEFDAMVGDIKMSMERLHYGLRERRNLLAIIETTRKEIVEKQ